MKKLTFMPLLALASVSASSVVTAAEQGQWYFTPSVTHIIADDDRKADNDNGLQLGFGQMLSQHWNLEVSAVADKLKLSNGSSEFKQYGLLVDALYFVDRDDSFDPYLVGGIGNLQTQFAGSKDHNLMANVGAGFVHAISDNVNMRADVRYRIDDDRRSIAGQNNFGDWLVNLGLIIPLGSPAKAAAPAPVAVVAAPAPMPAPVAAPAPAPVVEAAPKPVILDSDGDGVLDNADKCPNTAAGIKVDVRGCDIPDVIVLKGVNFHTASADLTEDSKVVLDDMAATLKKNADLMIEVAGHTDNVGKHAYNVSLSQRRAQSVMNYLVGQGVKADNLSAKGYGPDKPVADNGSAAGRAENRRVELHIIK